MAFRGGRTLDPHRRARSDPYREKTELGERRRRLSSLAQWIRTYKSQTRAAQPPLPRDPSFGTCSHRRERGCVGGLITSISGRES